MLVLKKFLARELILSQNIIGKWHFEIKEGDKVFFQSGNYNTNEECYAAGIRTLDVLHEENPLHSDYIPSVGDFMHVVDGGKK